MPALFRRGWAEKRITSCRKTLAHTLATRRIMPAWAITAVPGDVLMMAEKKDEETGYQLLCCSRWLCLRVERHLLLGRGGARLLLAFHRAGHFLLPPGGPPGYLLRSPWTILF